MATAHLIIYFKLSTKTPQRHRTISISNKTLFKFNDNYERIAINNGNGWQFDVSNFVGIKLHVDKAQSSMYNYSQFKEIVTLLSEVRESRNETL